MPPPPAPSDSRHQTKRMTKPLSWRSLSLNRKDRIKTESSRSRGALFRSPSVYDDDRHSSPKENEEDVMASYLAEKICPLTPSQKPTDIAHLVQRNPAPTSDCNSPSDTKKDEEMKDSGQLALSDPVLNFGGVCSIM
jgi:hypothetical protein